MAEQIPSQANNYLHRVFFGGGELLVVEGIRNIKTKIWNCDWT